MLVILFPVLAAFIKAGDKEDVMSAIHSKMDTFNKQDVNAYPSNFVEENTEFPNMVFPLRCVLINKFRKI